MDIQKVNLDNNMLPTVLIIFGITGDLSRRKLIPSLWNLFIAGELPKQFRVIGFARRAFPIPALHTLILDSVGEGIANADETTRKSFLKIFSYRQGHFDESRQYLALAKHVEEIENNFNTRSNRLLYLAVAPVHYEDIFEALRDSGIASSDSDKINTRILVEKPFGRDIKTARALDKKLASFFDEKQIYRVDHYLAKETVQNILTFRFANFMFEPLWNKDGIEKVHIELLETIGMEGRATFYSSTGALRDVGQNHMLQLLAMVAMEVPKKFDAEHVRVKRAEVLRKIKPIEDITKQAVRGRYEGFSSENGVAGDSNVETYFALRTFIDNPAWEGVPFILESGKHLHKRITRITIYFKNNPHTLCPVAESGGCQNTLTFEVQPEEGITVCFWAKKTGFSSDIEKKELHFSYKDSFNTKYHIPHAYERVLFDSIRGDQTLFTSTDEVQASWNYITPILESWKKLPFETYVKGSRGPDAGRALFNDS